MRKQLTPCPSPNGTNHERLYIVRAPRMALDQALNPDKSAQADAYEDLCRFLADRLSPDDMVQAGEW